LLTNQANLESIAAQAIGYTNECPEGEAARDIDTDWMYSFAAYAERVSDEHMQKLWAKILAKSATPTQPRITPVALQTMSLINKETALDFQKFCSVVLVSVRKHVESTESVVIPWRRSDSPGGADVDE